MPSRPVPKLAPIAASPAVGYRSLGGDDDDEKPAPAAPGAPGARGLSLNLGELGGGAPQHGAPRRLVVAQDDHAARPPPGSARGARPAVPHMQLKSIATPRAAGPDAQERAR